MKNDIYNDPISVVAKDNVENLIWVDLDTSKTVCEQIMYIRNFINSTKFNDYNISIIGTVSVLSINNIIVLDFLAQLSTPLTIWYRGVLSVGLINELRRRFKNVNFSKVCLKVNNTATVDEKFIADCKLEMF